MVVAVLAAVIVDDQLLEQLATAPGLFHVGADGKAFSRALTVQPLRALLDVLEPGMRTLETGCGGTTVVFAAAGTKHTVVTPSEDEAERVRAFCRDQGISLDQVEFRIGSSEAVLPGWSEKLDLVLVDGAHRVPFPFLDWYFTASALKVGGRLYLDDVPIPAVHLLFRFLCSEPEWRLDSIHSDKLAVFTKVAEPPEDATRDWELQRFNLPWKYGHVPWSRRWRRLRDQAMIGTRLRRRLGRA